MRLVTTTVWQLLVVVTWFMKVCNDKFVILCGYRFLISNKDDYSIKVFDCLSG